MDSKFIKSHQCSLERSHVALVEINPEFSIRPSPFSTKTDFYRSTSHKILQKQNNEDSLYSITLFLATPHHQQLPSLIHIYRRNSCPTHIFKPTHQPGFFPSRNISDKFTIGTFVDFCNQV